MRLARVLPLVALVACSTGAPPQPPARPSVARVSIEDLANTGDAVPEGRLAFEADVERVEEAPDGVWIHVRDGEARLGLFLRLSFGAALREALGRGRARFEVEIVGRRKTPEGGRGIEIVPFVLSQTPEEAHP